MLIFTYFKSFCSSTFVNGGIATGLTDFSSFFRRRYGVAVDAVIDPWAWNVLHISGPELFLVSSIIPDRDHWETATDLPLSALFSSFEGTVTNFPSLKMFQ